VGILESYGNPQADMIAKVIDDVRQYAHDREVLRTELLNLRNADAFDEWQERSLEKRNGPMRRTMKPQTAAIRRTWTYYCPPFLNPSRLFDHGELMDVLNEIGVKVPRDRLRRICRFMDDDGDGFVSFEEFVDALGLEIVDAGTSIENDCINRSRSSKGREHHARLRIKPTSIVLEEMHNKLKKDVKTLANLLEGDTTYVDKTLKEALGTDGDEVSTIDAVDGDKGLSIHGRCGYRTVDELADAPPMQAA